MTRSVYLVAIENSADHLGAELTAQLKKKSPQIECLGIGGPAMLEQGIEPEIDISGLAILGFVEGVSAYPMIMKRIREAVDSIMKHRPDAVVLIDSWGFMIRLAKQLKKQGYTGRVIKYVAPQVWAMREGRAKILAQYVDHLMSIHSFDAQYFEKEGLTVTYVGNPIFDTDYRSGDGAALRKELGIGPNDELVSVFFGSRLSELKTLSSVFAQTVERLKNSRSHIKFISPLSASIATDVLAEAGTDLRLQHVILLDEGRKFDVFAASNVAIACSGTVTTQLACAGVPTVVSYKLNALTYAVAQRLYRPDHISIVNIAAGERLMPEFIQGDVNADNISREVASYLNDVSHREETSKRLIEQTNSMQGQGGLASERAAQTVLSLLV